ncbi:MAG: ABC transporter ATP-binding protein [Sphingobacterium sp.]
MEQKKPVAIDYNDVLIRVDHVSKSFGDLHVLRDVDLELFNGENLVVLGRSGTGKSVLIKLISGLLKPDSGNINVLGDTVNHLNEKELRMLRLKIGFSFQNSALYDSMTVRENLEFPLVRNKRKLSRSEIDREVEDVLDGVGLLNAINQMPAELSGGQRKRIGIARTLILRPDIMMYDEPTAGLDPITCLEVNTLINEVQERYKTSSIIITHDLACAKMVGDRIAMLLDGKFERVGKFAQIFDTDDKKVKPFYDYNFIV